MLAVVVAFSTEMLTFHVFKQYFLEVEMRFKHSNLCVCVVEWFNEPPLTWTMWCNQFCPMKSRLCCLDNNTNTIENFDSPAFFFFERREQYAMTKIQKRRAAKKRRRENSVDFHVQINDDVRNRVHAPFQFRDMINSHFLTRSKSLMDFCSLFVCIGRCEKMSYHKTIHTFGIIRLY